MKVNQFKLKALKLCVEQKELQINPDNLFIFDISKFMSYCPLIYLFCFDIKASNNFLFKKIQFLCFRKAK